MIVNQLATAVVDLGGAFSTDRINYSIKMTILGIGAVFTVLAIIWLILAIFRVFLYDIPNKRKVEKPKTVHVESKTVDTTPQGNPDAMNTVAPMVTTVSDDAVIAAITAAITAYIADDPNLSSQYAGGFRVVSFKRVRAKASWNTKNN